jgi:hypothetical protein
MIRISKWFVAIVLYLFILLGLMAFRPALMFDAEGNPKQAGLGLNEGHSFFAPGIAFPLIAVVCYICATLTHIVFV